MPITLASDDEQGTIIRLIYEDPWTWGEYIALGYRLLAMLDASPSAVHMIVDLTDSHQLPTGFTLELFQYTGQHGPLTHERMGVMVMVMSALVHSTLFGVFQKLYPKYRDKIVRTDTLDEAYAMLGQLPRDGAQS